MFRLCGALWSKANSFLKRESYVLCRHIHSVLPVINPPFPFPAWGNLGNILNAQKRHAEAEAAYRQALLYRSNMADVHYNLGILLQELARKEEAIESYQKAITCRPKLTGEFPSV